MLCWVVLCRVALCYVARKVICCCIVWWLCMVCVRVLDVCDILYWAMMYYMMMNCDV